MSHFMGRDAALPQPEQLFIGREWVFQRINVWLADPDAAGTFLLTGGPGSGKTAIARRLVELSAAQAPDPAYPALGPDSITFHHFCVAFNDGTLDPLTFVTALALRLSTFPAFAEALATVRQAGITIDAKQTIGTAAAGSSVRNVVIETLHVSNLSARTAFAHIVRGPLEALCARDPTLRIVILVDSLDEALTYAEHEQIVGLLATNRDWPPQVRFILTSRPDDQVLSSLGPAALDLIADAPDAVADVHAYALRRLDGVPEPKRTNWAAQIAARANGIFLYARYVLDAILSDLERVQKLDELALPANLQDHYRQYLKRELARNVQQWKRTYRPIMGVLAVARGDGLGLEQIAGATRRSESQVDTLLSVCDQYLVFPTQRGPFQIYHASFREFLLRDEFYQVFPGEANLALANYLLKLYDGRWRTCNDEYALLHAPAHLAEAVRQASQPARRKEAQRLVRLVLDDGFQARIAERYTDLAAIEHNLELALNTLADDVDLDAIPPIVAAALALVQFRQQRLRPERLFDLAAEGLVREAEGMLALFGAEPRWRHAALLTCAWLAADRNVPGAVLLHHRVAELPDDTWPLPLMRERVGAALTDDQPTLPALPAPPPAELAQLLVGRMGGEPGGEYPISEHVHALAPAADVALREAIGALPDEAPLFLAEQDGPLLAAYALAEPGPGDDLFDQYVGVHAANGYTHYRNLSLWILLDAVLRHPDPQWARRQCRNLVTAALGGDRLLFQDGLGYTLTVLKHRAGKAAATRTLKTLMRELGAAAPHEGDPWAPKTLVRELVATTPQERDPWALRKRRRQALAEALQLAPDLQAEMTTLLTAAVQIDSGFAGFFAPALLTLAETIAICRPDDRAALDDCLSEALTAAHNVQEPTFCAVNTARVNALQRFWWATDRAALGVPPLDAAIRALSAEPDGRYGATLHIVGEQYVRRAHGPDKLELPWLMSNARSLRYLADVYRQPVTELIRLNQGSGWGPDEELPIGAMVWIPDPGFPPILAAALAAMVLADPHQSAGQRVVLIQHLVPPATANPTALDSVLSRLLSAAAPLDPSALTALTRSHERYRADAPLPLVATDAGIGVTVEQTINPGYLNTGTQLFGLPGAAEAPDSTRDQ